MADNAADREQVKEKAQKERLNVRRESDDMREVLALKGGRRMLWQFLSEAGVFSSVFSSDPVLMAGRSGKQDFGHYLLSKITEADQEAFFTMMRESKQKSEETNP